MRYLLKFSYMIVKEVSTEIVLFPSQCVRERFYNTYGLEVGVTVDVI